jgi:glycerophosphoryl diester phosphodiesterase
MSNILLDPLAYPIIAHRGASGEYPENTMLAFARGLEQGADAIELDVRATADGVPVVLHDATLERTTDGVGPLGAHTLASLKQVHARAAERVPTLAQVLETFPVTALLIEIKEWRVAAPLLAVIRAHAAEPRVVVAAFAGEVLRPFRHSGIDRAATRGKWRRSGSAPG